MIKIIVDSTCDLPVDMFQEYDVKTLPLRIQLNEKDYSDKLTISVDEVYEAMKSGVYPQTSQPKPLDMYELFRGYASKGLNFIYLSFSSKLSGTYQLACGVMQEIKEQYPNIKMEIIDTKSGSTAIGLMVIQAIKLIRGGKSFESVVNTMRELSKHVEHIFTITDLNWLIKGGRLSKSQGFIGNMLDIKPILHVNDGLMEVIAKVRGKKRALSNVVEIVSKRMIEFPDQIIGISHADDIETALQLQRMINDRMGEKRIIINKIGSVLGSHLGIGGVGVFFFNKKPSLYID